MHAYRKVIEQCHESYKIAAVVQARGTLVLILGSLAQLVRPGRIIEAGFRFT